MIRKLGVFAVMAALMLMVSVSALAAVNFKSTSRSINNDGALVVSFDASGLGNVSETDASVSANYTAQFGCYNRGGNHPQAANKETVTGEVSAAETVPVHNGRARGTLTTDTPDAGGFSCPGNQVLNLMDVTYTDIVLTVGGESIQLDDVTRTFYAE